MNIIILNLVYFRLKLNLIKACLNFRKFSKIGLLFIKSKKMIRMDPDEKFSESQGQVDHSLPLLYKVLHASCKPFNTSISPENDFNQQNFYQANISSNEQPKDNKETIGFQKRQFQIIQTSFRQKQKHFQCYKGERQQTRNHCKHLSTELSKYFKTMSKSNEINEEERPFIKSFLKKRGKTNILCFNKLCANKQLRQKCLQFLQSNDLPINILSSRAAWKNKLILIKYLEEFRRIGITGKLKKCKTRH